MNERTEQAMREAFETWAFNEGLDIGRSYMQLPTRCYISLNTNSAWRAWQAAQASIATPQQTVRSALEKAARKLDNMRKTCTTDFGKTALSMASEEIRAIIEPLSAADEHQKAVRDLVTYGQSFMVGDKHVPLSDVLLSAATCVCGEPQAANTVHRADGPCYQSSATGGQESEAQAIAIVDAIEVDPSKRTIKCLSYERLLGISAGTKLYTAPPSALAIETAALRKAAALVSGNYGWKYGGGSGEYCDDFGDAVLALIPQDGITALEQFGMDCIKAALFEVSATGIINDADNSTHAIVTSLIASPTLDKEAK